MCRKAFIFCFFYVALLAFTACTKEPESTPQVDETYEAILFYFMPEGAEIVTDKENFLVINSTQPFSELVDFYENVCNKLILHEAEIDDTQDGIWIFSGLYNGFHIHQRGSGYEDGKENRERPLNITLRDNGKSAEIDIIY